VNQVSREDQAHIKQLFRRYKSFSLNELIRETYIKYPYFAINSEILDKLLSSEEKSKVKSSIKTNNSTELFTIGYEGISIEKYLNKLIVNDVRLLCDVRKNPISRKIFFSKSRLKKYVEALGIKYLHIPELGINSSLRRDLKSQKDYNELFDRYEDETLKNEKESLSNIWQLLEKNKRIALTCFEDTHIRCHRGRIADSLIARPDWKYTVKHL
jgi:uncharacterized protein (DUF488 family)